MPSHHIVRGLAPAEVGWRQQGFAAGTGIPANDSRETAASPVPRPTRGRWGEHEVSGIHVHALHLPAFAAGPGCDAVGHRTQRCQYATEPGTVVWLGAVMEGPSSPSILDTHRTPVQD